MLTDKDLEKISEVFRQIVRSEIEELIEKTIQSKKDEYLSVDETARLVGCSKKTLYSKSCQIPHFKQGKYLKFSRTDVLRYLGVIK
jgi:excisionase family DNA binding protein